VTDEENLELTREGLFDKPARKAKEAAGELAGNEDLANKGREQQAEVDADAKAARDAEQAE
jgi:uncharacterized protein YjbJ (UPF0337 family)